MSSPDEPPHVLCAPDKLRGALTAAAAASALAAGVRDAGGSARELPIADGGEGTLDAFGDATLHAVTVADALGCPRVARLAELPAAAFVVEAAEAVPLHALADDERDVLRASSHGVGELIAAALDRGARRILVAVGGTANVDGGAGLLRALGARAPRDGGELLRTYGDGAPARADDAAASGAATAGAPGSPALDLSTLDARLAAVQLDLLADVAAPLTGRAGAARRFGPQKGATPAQVDALDAALARWAGALGIDPAAPGAGAAGGIGAALQALGARTLPGAEAVLDLLGFDAQLRGAGLCITAEGSVDASTLQGKAVSAVVARCAAAGVPVVVLGGRVEQAAGAELLRRGARAVAPLGPPGRPLAVAVAAAAGELRAAAASAARSL